MADDERVYTTRLAQSGQVTIPKPIREKLRLEIGQILTLHEEGGRIVLVPSRLVPQASGGRE